MTRPRVLNDRMAPWAWPRMAWRAMRSASLATQFAVASAVILIGGALVLGAWVTREIENSVIQVVAIAHASHIEALVAPYLGDLPADWLLSDGDRRALAAPLARAASEHGATAIRIWNSYGVIVEAEDPRLVGSSPGSEAYDRALAGTVGSERTTQAIETWIPIHRTGSGAVVAVAELQQRPDHLDYEVGRARASTWAIIAIATIAMYALLARMVGIGSDTIARQRRALETAFADLRATSQRVRDAIDARIETDEALRRRVAQELHDGLAQDLVAALQSLPADDPSVARLRASLESARREVRWLETGLALPDLERLTVDAVIEQVCADHERRTGRVVARDIAPMPEAGASLKIGVYRVLQEALSNVQRHAPEAHVHVRAYRSHGSIRIECEDDGPGIPLGVAPGLGMRGMRERIELLGGALELGPGQRGGTKLVATVPIAA